jgi:hypothetical protein
MIDQFNRPDIYGPEPSTTTGRTVMVPIHDWRFYRTTSASTVRQSPYFPPYPDPPGKAADRIGLEATETK